jgi:hypothetical protein
MTENRKKLLQLCKTIAFSLLATALVISPASVRSIIDSFQRGVFFRCIAEFNTEIDQPIAQLFFDIGKGFKESDSIKKSIQKTSNQQTLYFRLPIRDLIRLRLDPINGPGKILLKECSIIDRKLKILYSIDLDQIVPIQGIYKIKNNEAGLALKTFADATDPILIVPLPSMFSNVLRENILKNAFQYVYRLYLIYFFPIFLAFFLSRHNSCFNLKTWSKPGKTVGISVSSEKLRQKLIVFSIAIFVMILFLRSWENLINLGLYVEDTTHYFNRYYGGQEPFITILQRPNGYYAILNNIVAWFSAKLPVTWQPYAYQLYSLFLSVLTSVCLLFSNLFLAPITILIMPLVLGFSGMNHINYYIVLTFQMYVGIILLICIMFLKTPQTGLGFTAMILACILLIWSGPYSVIAVPVAYLFLVLFNERKKNALMVWIILSTFSYTSTAQSLIQLSNVFDLTILSKIVTIFIEKVLFLDLLQSINPSLVLLLTIALVSCIWFLRKEPGYIRYTIIFWSVITLALTPLFFSIKLLSYPDPYPVHFFISQFFWLAWLLFTSDTIIRKKTAHRIFTVLFPAFFIFIVLIDNIQHQYNRHYQPMRDLPAFLSAVSDAEKLRLENQDQFVILWYKKGRSIFKPVVRVGSRKTTAERIGKKEIPINSIRRFILE